MYLYLGVKRFNDTVNISNMSAPMITTKHTKAGDMENQEICTVLVRHLPAELSPSEKEDLLRHFGAEKVKVMGQSGSMKHTAFATFKDQEKAKKAISRIHQLEVLGCRLIAVLANKSQSVSFPHLQEPEKKEGKKISNESPKEETTKPNVSFPSHDDVFQKWSIDYPRNPKLKYLYPPPTVNILANIANALAACPKFYVQVLHLMNKMNLPAPFGAVTPTPPIPVGGGDLEDDAIAEVDMSPSDESEINSDTEIKRVKVEKDRKRPPAFRRKDILKKPKIAIVTELPWDTPPSLVSSVPVQEVFEQPSNKSSAKSIQLNISAVTLLGDEKLSDAVKYEATENGFGKIEPPPSAPAPTEMSDSLLPYCLDPSCFLDKSTVRKGCISSSEMKNFSVFKRYDKGDPTQRLYIKNLGRQATEQDLANIYGSYLDLTSETDKDVFDVRLMKEGRMKGQAFVTLPTQEMAAVALANTNGYVLHAKPMVVQFARSAKAKE